MFESKTPAIKPDYEIKHFTRIIWRTPEYKEKWQPRIQRIARAYSRAEYEMVRRGYRRAATYHVDANNFGSFIEKIQKDGLYFFPIAKSAYYQGFSHYHVPPKPGEPFYWYGALVRDPADGELFRKASHEKDGHLVIGDLLGYPRCCTEFFTDVWSQGFYDPLWQAAENDGDPVIGKNTWLGTEDRYIIYIPDAYPEAIQELRYFGIRITSHLPHSHRCEETRKIGKIWAKVIGDLDEDARDWLYEILSSPIVWDSYHGVVQVHTPWFVGLSHTYPYLDKRRLIILNSDEIPWDIDI